MITKKIYVRLPIRTVNPTNRREHWGARHKRTKKERQTVRLLLGPHVVSTDEPLEVLLVRVAPRRLDDDNLTAALKAVRDEIAALLGRDDRLDSGIAWRYDQRRGKKGEYAVEVFIQKNKPC